LLLPILPKGTVFVFDREFTYPELMKFLMKNGMYFIIRLKRNVYVNGKPLWKLGSGVYENVLVHKVIANVFVRGFLCLCFKSASEYAKLGALQKKDENRRDV